MWTLDDKKMLKNKDGLWKSDDLWIFKMQKNGSIYIENTSQAKFLGVTNDTSKVILKDIEELWKKRKLDAEGEFVKKTM